MKQNNDMKQMYIQPRMEVADMAPQQIICDSGEGYGWAEMGSYEENSGGGFTQPF